MAIKDVMVKSLLQDTTVSQHAQTHRGERGGGRVGEGKSLSGLESTKGIQSSEDWTWRQASIYSHSCLQSQQLHRGQISSLCQLPGFPEAGVTEP